MADNDLDDDDTLATLVDLASQPKPQSTASGCLATEALRLALNRQTRRLISRGSSVIIIDVPDAGWVDLIGDAAAKLDQRIITKPARERSVVSKVPVPVGADTLRHLQHARSVIFVSQDPEAILAPDVLTAADARVGVPAVSPALLRKVIRQVSGGVARGVTPKMAALPLSAIISAIRPGLPARACVNNLGRASVPPVKPPASTVPLLDRLPLTQDLRRWADDTLADLQVAAAKDLAADALLFGVLEGPAGTGKTMLVRSLAQTSGWNFVSSSVGTWFTTQDGTLGTVARNLRTFIDEILSSEPAIGFLDELDALPDRATLDARGLDW
jgi:cell division protease FtsH